MKVYISVASHYSTPLITENYSDFPTKVKGHSVILNIIDNIGEKVLNEWCIENDVNYYHDETIRGYGANHNKNFNLINPDENDLFIVMNPDVKLSKKNFEGIVEYYLENYSDLLGVKVYESSDLSIWSSHNRSYPALLDPLISLLLKKKLFENDADKFANPDWIGGAFMAYKSSVYKDIKGFDDYFFMYYEDIDICRRLKRKGYQISYNPDYYIIHDAQRAGRKYFSRAFFMMLVSLLKYFLRYPTFRVISI